MFVLWCKRTNLPKIGGKICEQLLIFIRSDNATFINVPLFREESVVFADCTNSEDNLPNVLWAICARMKLLIVLSAVSSLSSHIGSWTFIFNGLHANAALMTIIGGLRHIVCELRTGKLVRMANVSWAQPQYSHRLLVFANRPMSELRTICR